MVNLAFVAAFVVYEAALYVTALAVLGGTEEFTLAIVGRVLEVNAIAMAAMLLVNLTRARVSKEAGVPAMPA